MVDSCLFGGEIAYKNLLTFEKEFWMPLTAQSSFSFTSFYLILGVGHKWEGVEIYKILVNWGVGANELKWVEKNENSVIDPPTHN